MNVQWQSEYDQPADKESQLLTSVVCPACAQLHFIDKRIGKLSGEK